MRKKLFAALALQLAAVIFILLFSVLMSSLTERKGTEYSLPCRFGECYYSVDSNGRRTQDICLSFYSTGEELTGFDGNYSSYRRISENASGADMYVYNVMDSDEKSEKLSNIWGTYYFSDRTLGDAFYNKYIGSPENMEDFFSERFYRENEVRANIKIYRNRLMFVSVTVNGIELENYLRNY